MTEHDAKHEDRGRTGTSAELVRSSPLRETTGAGHVEAEPGQGLDLLVVGSSEHPYEAVVSAGSVVFDDEEPTVRWLKVLMRQVRPAGVQRNPVTARNHVWFPDAEHSGDPTTESGQAALSRLLGTVGAYWGAWRAEVVALAHGEVDGQVLDVDDYPHELVSAMMLAVYETAGLEQGEDVLVALYDEGLPMRVVRLCKVDRPSLHEALGRTLSRG